MQLTRFAVVEGAGTHRPSITYPRSPASERKSRKGKKSPEAGQKGIEEYLPAAGASKAGTKKKPAQGAGQLQQQQQQQAGGKESGTEGGGGGSRYSLRSAKRAKQEE